MKKLLVRIALVAAGIAGTASAQQDPQFTQWMFNRLIYNPGYAGTSGAICGVAQYRQQWASYPGNPTSIAFAGDMRLKSLPLGVGLNVISDKIAAINTTNLRLAASYNILKLAGGTLGIGLDLGMIQKKINDDWVTPEPLKNDPSIPGYQNPNGTSNPNLNKATFDLGFGAFYNIPGKMYLGISSTHLPAQDIKDGDVGFKVSRHYYIMGGYSFQLNKWSKLTPNVLYKFDNAATSLDLNLTYLWSDMIWLGGTYRTSDKAPAVLLGYQGRAGYGNALGYKIGISYDVPNALGSKYGSYEMVLGVCYTMKVKKPTTYGNDRYLD